MKKRELESEAAQFANEFYCYPEGEKNLSKKLALIRDVYERAVELERERSLPRKKPCPPQGERVERWMVVYQSGGSMTYTSGSDAKELAQIEAKKSKDARVVHLVELKPGEVPVSRQALASAWLRCGMSDPSKSPSKFFLFLSKLGFEGSAP